MNEYTTDIDRWLQDAEELAQDGEARYVALALVYRQNGGTPEPYCTLADWPETQPARLTALARENAELRAELDALRTAQTTNGHPPAEPLPPAPQPVEQGRVSCPECGQLFHEGHSMANHRARTHGVKGRNSGYPVNPQPVARPAGEVVVCRYCGKECDPRGVKSHERCCPARPAEPEPPEDAPRPAPDRRQQLARAQQRVLELEREHRRLAWKKDAESQEELAEVKRQLNDARAAYRAAQSGNPAGVAV